MKNSTSATGIWPRSVKKRFPPTTSSATQIEIYLKERFKNGHPVVFSSGRSAMNFVLKHFFKKQTVRLFPFASQCVVQSVLNAGLTPVTPTDYTSLDISYNQWGKLNRDLSEAPFIEDSVDSFYQLNSKVLRSGAQFEIWSLPKILGTEYGAILWCNRIEDAEKIKQTLQTSGTVFTKTKRNLYRRYRGVNHTIYKLWEKYEFQNIPLLPHECGEIFTKIKEWETFYSKRMTQFANKVQEMGLDANSELMQFEGVVPVVIEIPEYTVSKSKNEIMQLHRIIGVSKPKLVCIFPYQNRL